MPFGMAKMKRIAEAEEKADRRAKRDIRSYLPKADEVADADCSSKRSMKRKMKIPLEEEVDEDTFEEAKQLVKEERRLVRKAERKALRDRAKMNPLLKKDGALKKMDPEGQRHWQVVMNYPKQKVWVKNLPEEVTEEMLGKHFEGCGETLRVEICKKRNWGIVVFVSEKATPHALKLNGSELAGQKVEVLLFSDDAEEEVFNTFDPALQVIFCNFPMTCRINHVRAFVKSFGFVTRLVVPMQDGTKGPKTISQGKAFVSYLTETGVKNALAQHGTFCRQDSGSLQLKACEPPPGFEDGQGAKKKGVRGEKPPERPKFTAKKGGDGYCRVLVVKKTKMTGPSKQLGLKFLSPDPRKPAEWGEKRAEKRRLAKKARKAAREEDVVMGSTESKKKKQKKGEEEEADGDGDDNMEGDDE